MENILAINHGKVIGERIEMKRVIHGNLGIKKNRNIENQIMTQTTIRILSHVVVGAVAIKVQVAHMVIHGNPILETGGNR